MKKMKAHRSQETSQCQCVPAGEENCSRTLLQPSVMMNDCFPTRLHSVSLETEHLNTLVSSPGKEAGACKELR